MMLKYQTCQICKNAKKKDAKRPKYQEKKTKRPKCQKKIPHRGDTVAVPKLEKLITLNNKSNSFHNIVFRPDSKFV